MTMSQTAINARCTRWLADQLEHRGIADAHALAEHIAKELLAQGLAPVPRPFPIRSTGPTSTKEGRAAARAEYERIRDEKAKAKAAPDAGGEGES